MAGKGKGKKSKSEQSKEQPWYKHPGKLVASVIGGAAGLTLASILALSLATRGCEKRDERVPLYQKTVSKEIADQINKIRDYQTLMEELRRVGKEELIDILKNTYKIDSIIESYKNKEKNNYRGRRDCQKGLTPNVKVEQEVNIYYGNGVQPKYEVRIPLDNDDKTKGDDRNF
ncbi:MAG: hypothetical protein NZ889_01080 [Candidatus Pacearchaeota archaeon]|nr:hypothetical protein [Candidatus Pacearchaeota archaeon]